MTRWIVAAALLCVPATANAAMDVATFLAKADALKAKGVRALFSSDLKVIKSEIATASAQLQAEKAARDKAGLPPRSCPPKGAKMGAEDFMAQMRAIPAAQQRTMPLKDGILWVAQRKYPCR